MFCAMQVFVSAETAVHVDLDMTTVARQLQGQMTLGRLDCVLKELTAFFGCAAWTQWGRRRKLDALMCYVRRDDELLGEQGLDRCSAEELIECCSQRGLRVVNMTRTELADQLDDWHRAASMLGTPEPGALCTLAVLMFYRCVLPCVAVHSVNSSCHVSNELGPQKPQVIGRTPRKSCC